MRVRYRDLGTMPYEECWRLQRQLFDAMLARKSAAGGAVPAGADAADNGSDDYAGDLLIVEHPAVYTLGKSGRESNMLVSEEFLRTKGAEFHRIDRGGDITFHGPGQIVGYPILDLGLTGHSLKEYVAAIEESVIETVAAYGIAAGRIAGASGVWIDEKTQRARKICAIGVRASRYVTMHGFALNVATDLSWFDYINPCGFTDRGVTSIERETGRPTDMDDVKRRLRDALSKNLNVKIYKI
ncbi:MAG: lipoyl(octanoyl) transferase LipB [Alistipes sp.]|nr:lipoyl(octanoyl) transferase LipB [Alistipes sp.]MDE6857807.1 lipoyl(octanoyl) transferase LipB [Alistipes sp.]